LPATARTLPGEARKIVTIISKHEGRNFENPGALFDHLVRKGQESRRQRQSNCLRRCDVGDDGM
jgi:hypothetical protein